MILGILCYIPLPCVTTCVTKPAGFYSSLRGVKTLQIQKNQRNCWAFEYYRMVKNVVLVVVWDAGLVPTIAIDLVSQELLNTEAGLCLRRSFGIHFVRS